MIKSLFQAFLSRIRLMQCKGVAMSKIEIPISDRCRKYGYIYWSKSLDTSLRNFFKDASIIDMIFDGARLGKKTIDWRYRRISVGWRWTRQVASSAQKFILAFDNEGSVKVVCR